MVDKTNTMIIPFPATLKSRLDRHSEELMISRAAIVRIAVKKLLDEEEASA